jgi:hypothetical protein
VKPHLAHQCLAIARTLTSTGNVCVEPRGHEGLHKTWAGLPFRHGLDGHGAHASVEDAIVKLCQCTKHKRYKAAKQPRNSCELCWRLWVLLHPSIEIETRWMR